MSKSETTSDDCWTAADLVAWLRVEGRARQGMEADEAQWCSRLNEAADEIERLRWLPEKTTSRDPWDAGWNRCLEYILDKRAGIKPGDGEHE